MASVEMARDEIVETVVVNSRQTIGPFDVLPDPGLERRLDFCELVLGRLGVGGVEDPLLDAVLDECVVDLRQRGVERVHHEVAGVTAGRSPVGRRGRIAREGMDIDRPTRDFDRVIDAGLDPQHVFGERGHDIGRDPRRAEPGGDVGGLQVLRQCLLERPDIAPVARIERDAAATAAASLVRIGPDR